MAVRAMDKPFVQHFLVDINAVSAGWAGHFIQLLIVAFVFFTATAAAALIIALITVELLFQCAQVLIDFIQSIGQLGNIVFQISLQSKRCHPAHQ